MSENETTSLARTQACRRCGDSAFPPKLLGLCADCARWIGEGTVYYLTGECGQWAVRPDVDKLENLFNACLMFAKHLSRAEAKAVAQKRAKRVVVSRFQRLQLPPHWEKR